MIHKAKLRGKRLRFVLHEDDLFVPKSDMDAFILDAAPSRLKTPLKGEGGIDAPEFRALFPVGDLRSVNLGDAIGLGVHALGVGEMILGFGSLDAKALSVDPHNGDAVAIFGRRMTMLLPLYTEALAEAIKTTDASPNAQLALLLRRQDRINHAFDIRIEHDDEDGSWLGFNEEIGLFIEAGSYEELMRESWLVVPELLELNGIDVVQSEDGTHELYNGPLRLNFVQSTTALRRQIA